MAVKTRVLSAKNQSFTVARQSYFIDTTEECGLQAINATETQILVVDYDGDSWTDLFIRKNDSPDNFETGERYSWLLRNTEEGSFTDVTETSGIRQARTLETGPSGQVVAFTDIDNDGDLDVYTGHNFFGNSTETSEILLNNGAGSSRLGHGVG